MIASTDTEWAPWYLAHSDDKKRARLNVISHLLSRIPYDPQPDPDVRLPKRHGPRGYAESDYPFTYVPTRF